MDDFCRETRSGARDEWAAVNASIYVCVRGANLIAVLGILGIG